MVRILSKVGYQMCEVGTRWHHVGSHSPQWRQDGHLELNLGGLGGILGLTWWILEGSWRSWGGFLEEFWDVGGILKTYGFLQVFNDFEVFWVSGKESSCHLGAYVGRCWVQDGSKMSSREV